MKKRFLSFMLVAAMLLSFMPVMAFAANKGLGNGLGEGNAWDISASGDRSVLAWLEKTSETPTYILHIDGTGAMMSFSKGTDNLWYNHREEIKSVSISNDITSIGDFAFYECSSLLNVIIPEKVTSIGTRSFYGCSKLTNVTIPSNVTTIGQEAFSECSTLTGVTFTSPSSIKTINSAAFENCVALTSLTIPKSVTKIYDAVFSGCNALTEIAVEANNKNYLSEDGILFSNDNKKLICYPANKTGVSYIIPDTVTSINNYAFRHSNLNSVTLPKNLTYMGSYVFCECTNLASISIPSGVTNIGNYAFKDCSQLATVTCLATTPPTLGNNKVFTGCAIGLKITVPSQSIDEYKKATNWSGYANKIVGGHIVDGVIFEPWEDDDSLPETAGNYYLDTDVEISSTWNVPTGATPTNLDLNGHVIKADTSSSSFGAITIGEGATLNLYDCGTTEHKFYIDENGLWVLDETNGTETITGGCITGGKEWGVNSMKSGGGVHVTSNGAFNMFGGNIIGNSAQNNGGGVCVSSNSAFIMSGGAIIGNYAEDGGGVYVKNDSFTLNYGTIIGNKAERNGGGVYLLGNDTYFEMAGGIVSGNCAKTFGGGVYVCSDTTFSMTDGKITNNIALGSTGGGGVVNCGTFNMSGGMITNNTASASNSNGGGVFNVGTFNMSGGKIADNTANNGGGVSISSGTCTMTGGAITGNTASNNGGGVYVNVNAITLGGIAKITGNKLTNDTANNLYLNNGKTVALATGTDIPVDGMLVGVTTAKEPTTATPVAITAEGSVCDTSYFVSDNLAYEVAKEESRLVLKLKSPKTITFDANGGTCVSGSAIASVEGKLAELPTATRNGYTFNGWYTLASGGENITTSTVFTSDTTIYAQWTKIPAPPAPSYDDDSSYSTVTVPVTGDENTVKVSATVSGNTATVKKIADADLEKITEGESVSIDLSAAGKNIDTAKIPTETVEKIAEKSSLTVKLPVATVEFDKAATEEIADQAKGSNIELVVDDVKEVSLNAIQKESVKKLDTAIIIDAHLVSNGSRLCTADNGGFGGGSAKVILPYEIKNNRKPENYSVFYVNEAGSLEKLNASYDVELKAFVFEIEHFSVYAVAFEQFVDIDANAYYYDAVKWAIENGITDGVDATHFSPNSITNRAQMVTFLWKAAGRPEPTITETPFTDLDPNRYYFKAVLWAYENGITGGTSATTFDPNANVNRAQVVTFLWRYSGGLSVDYWMQMSDVASGEYYSEAVRWALAEKITDGTSKTTFSPEDDCLRGQAVTFLYRGFGE